MVEPLAEHAQGIGDLGLDVRHDLDPPHRNPQRAQFAHGKPRVLFVDLPGQDLLADDHDCGGGGGGAGARGSRGRTGAPGRHGAPGRQRLSAGRWLVRGWGSHRAATRIPRIGALGPNTWQQDRRRNTRSAAGSSAAAHR